LTPSDSTPPRTASHAIQVALGILSSRLMGFVREALVARFLGVGAHADVYGTAFRAPNLLQNLLGEQSLSAAFIPIYSRMLAAGREEDAGRFAGAVFGMLLATAGALALIGIFLARPLVALFAAGFLADAGRVAAGEQLVDRFELAVVMVRVIFPMAGVLVLSAWALAVLNSHRRFFLPYFAPVLWNAAIIATVIWVGTGMLGGVPLDVDQRSSLVLALAWGALVGGALQFLVQVPSVARVLRGFRPALSLRVEGMREALGAFGPVVAARGVVQLSGYLDILLASLLAAGAVSALRFSQVLYLLPIGLFAMSVAAAELPELSRQRQGSPGGEGILERVGQGLRQIAFLTAPTAVGYLVFGFLVVGLVFRRGSFQLQDHWLVYLTLLAYTVGLLPTTWSRLLQNLFYSFGETRFPARVAVLRVCVSAACGAALMLWLDRYGLSRWLGAETAEQPLFLGAVGLALGSAVGSWLEAALLVRGARERVSGFALPLGAVGRMVALAMAAAALAAGLWWLLSALPLWAVALLVLGCYAAVYLAGSWLLGFPEPQAWLGALARRRRGG
jgi:putative peptidoglycan lipid II flippase